MRCTHLWFASRRAGGVSASAANVRAHITMCCVCSQRRRRKPAQKRRNYYNYVDDDRKRPRSSVVVIGLRCDASLRQVARRLAHLNWLHQLLLLPPLAVLYAQRANYHTPALCATHADAQTVVKWINRHMHAWSRRISNLLNETKRNETRNKKFCLLQLSAAFTAWRYDGPVSTCLSVTSQCSIKTAKHIVTDPTPHDSQRVYFSVVKRDGDIPVGPPQSGAPNTKSKKSKSNLLMQKGQLATNNAKIKTV